MALGYAKIGEHGATGQRGLFLRFGRAAPTLVTIRTLFGFFEAVRLALDSDDFGAVDESIDERYDAPCAWEDLLPLGERLVGGDDGTLLFVASVEQFKEQVRVAIAVREVADLVDLC